MNRQRVVRHRSIRSLKGQRPGVAIITVVFLMAILGLCMAVMARSYIAQMQLTAHSIARRQITLLMDAGVQIVERQAAGKSQPPRIEHIALPVALARQGGQLVIKRTADGPAVKVYQIRTAFESITRRCFITYNNITRQWRVERERHLK